MQSELSICEKQLDPNEERARKSQHILIAFTLADSSSINSIDAKVYDFICATSAKFPGSEINPVILFTQANSN